jgi:phosphatidate cytidylyltransferase
LPVYFFYTQQLVLFVASIPLILYISLPAIILLTQQTHDVLKTIGSIYWCVMLSVYPISFMAYILTLPPLTSYAVDGSSLFIYFVFLTGFNDIAQFTVGKTLGKRPIMPKISPKKTWGGFIGGIVSCALMSCLLAPLATPFDFKEALFLGVMLSVLGFAGDLTISAIKRESGVKDSGSCIPGQGGIMDRFDSTIYIAPFFLLYMSYFYYL